MAGYERHRRKSQQLQICRMNAPGYAEADACQAEQVRVVVFANPLTEQRRSVLGEIFGCCVISGEDHFTRDDVPAFSG
ncbi:hypothetical protein ACFFMR_18340 [Micromonospora andamanensis]|nr:hypothetical protein [Micromonospora andamanensis]